MNYGGWLDFASFYPRLRKKIDEKKGTRLIDFYLNCYRIGTAKSNNDLDQNFRNGK
jgi:hypothetical protein